MEQILRTILIVMTFVVLTGSVILLSSSLVFVKIIIYPKTRSRKQSYEDELKTGRLDQCKILSLNYQDVKVSSPFGYDLSGRYFANKSSKAVVLCHGINCTMFQSLKYAELFYDMGFSVLIYDQRNHGDSGGDFTSYGYFEKYDLKACIDYLCGLNGGYGVIGVHGESMGAAVALQTLNIDNRISFCIADCPFSDLEEMLALRLHDKYGLAPFPFMNLVEFLLNLLGKFDVHKVSPIKDMFSCNTPVLFVHGTADSLIPCSMSVDMYNSVPDKTVKELFLVKDARHTESIVKDKEGYGEAVRSFLGRLPI